MRRWPQSLLSPINYSGPDDLNHRQGHAAGGAISGGEAKYNTLALASDLRQKREPLMYDPTHRESDAALLGRLRTSLTDTADQLEANARYYMESAAKLRVLRNSIATKKPTRMVLREIVAMLSDAGTTHTGGENSDEVQQTIAPGWTAARILLDEIYFHDGEAYDRSDPAAMHAYRVAIGEIAPEPKPTAEQLKASKDRLEAFWQRLDPMLLSVKEILSEMRLNGAT